MAEFILSGFTDEYSQNFDEQIEGLKKNGMKFMEIRGVDGKNISGLNEEELRAAKAKLDAAGMGVSSIGSPVGKVSVDDDFDAHLKVLENCIKAAKILGTKNIRMFSFYIPEGKTREECRPEVMRRLGKMLEIAKKEDVILCHENESGIYGESPECCLDIQNEFNGEIKLIFDPANFLMRGYKPYPDAFKMLGDKVYYVHIKDANENRVICPAGQGVGGLPEIVAELDKKCSGKMFLSVEPHLRVFKGFEALERDESTKMPENTYATSYEAFTAAVDALKEILAK